MQTPMKNLITVPLLAAALALGAIGTKAQASPAVPTWPAALDATPIATNGTPAVVQPVQYYYGRRYYYYRPRRYYRRYYYHPRRYYYRRYYPYRYYRY